MSAGVMIGSGIFLLPAVIAPYGGVGYLGWCLAIVGVVLLALVLSRLAARTSLAGGPYNYARDAFGDLVGFLVAWGYWLSLVSGITAISVAFAAYLGTLIPEIGSSLRSQTLVAAAVIWLFTLINCRTVHGAASLQLLLTVLKIAPLVLVVIVGIAYGSSANLPAFNPGGQAVTSGIAGAALLAMWAFIGIEAAVIPAGNVRNAQRTIPRAVVAAAITVSLLYLGVSLAVSLLVPAEQLVDSEAPVIDALGRVLPWGGVFIGVAALVSTAGSLNGNLLLSGQMPMAVARDGLMPRFFARSNSGSSPYVSLLISASLSTALLVLNMTEDLLGAFTFLISISTLAILAPYAVSAAAELKHSWASAHGWGLVALLTLLFTLVAIAGSGTATLLWGLVLLVAGVPVFFVLQRDLGRAN